jgi:hypothetical protein
MTAAMMDGPMVTEDVLGLLRRQAALFVRLEQFAARQRGLVRADDAGPLLSVLADRQRLSTELTGIAARLAPVRSAWSRFRESLTDSQRAEADGLVAESSQRLRRVIEGDETDARLLSVKKRSVAGEMKALNGFGQAISVYRAPAQRPAAALRLDEST